MPPPAKRLKSTDVSKIFDAMSTSKVNPWIASQPSVKGMGLLDTLIAITGGGSPTVDTMPDADQVYDPETGTVTMGDYKPKSWNGKPVAGGDRIRVQPSIDRYLGARVTPATDIRQVLIHEFGHRQDYGSTNSRKSAKEGDRQAEIFRLAYNTITENKHNTKRARDLLNYFDPEAGAKAGEILGQLAAMTFMREKKVQDSILAADTLPPRYRKRENHPGWLDTQTGYTVMNPDTSERNVPRKKGK